MTRWSYFGFVLIGLNLLGGVGALVWLFWR